MSCGLSQGVVWCQIDVFWLGFLAIFVGVFTILWTWMARESGWSAGYRDCAKLHRRAEAAVEELDDESPSDSSPTTQTAAQKLSEQTDGSGSFVGTTESAAFVDHHTDGGPGDPWDPTERERVVWDGDSGSLPYGEGDEI